MASPGQPPAPHVSWTADEWRAYGAVVTGYFLRTGDHAWWDRVGRQCARMAEQRAAALTTSSEVE